MTTVQDVQRADRLPPEEPASGPTTRDDLSDGRSAAPAVERTALGRHFVEQLLSEALDAAARERGGPPNRVVDWPAIWASAQDAETREQSEGRVVLTAFRAALALTGQREIGPDASEVTGVVLLDRALVPEPKLPPFVAPAFPAPVLVPAVSPLVLAPAVPPPVGLRPGPAPITAAQTDSEPTAGSDELRSLRRRETLATAFGWIRNIGLFAILFAAWQVWGTGIAQHQAQASLATQFRSHVHHITPPSASGPHLIGADVRIAEPAEGSPVARIQIPKIGLDQYVVEGTAEGDLAKGPGHYVGTALPGQAGNIAIAGHRTTYGAPFNNLDQLTPADQILLTSASGEQLDYVVTQPPRAVPPNDVAVLAGFGDNRLTLTTCNPRFSASQRLVVVALLRETAGSGPVTAPKTSTSTAVGKPGRLRHIPSGGSVEWNLLYLPGVLAVLGVMVLLGLAHKRSAAFLGSWGRWLILVPIWAAATYLLFGLLTSFLPATL
jgi:sortase A